MFFRKQRRASEFPDPDASVIGLVEGVHNGRVTGWAVSRIAPSRRVTILIETAPDKFVTIVADRYRADVHRAKYSSDGYCGFALPVERLSWRGPLRIIAEAYAEELRGSPVLLDEMALG